MNESLPYRNPVIPGFFPDPSVAHIGGDYYLIKSTFQYFPAIVISHSRDLLNWRQIGHLLTDSGVLNLTTFHDGCGNLMVKSKSIHDLWSTPVQLTDHGNDPSHFVDADGAHYLLYVAGIQRGSATEIVCLGDDCTSGWRLTGTMNGVFAVHHGSCRFLPAWFDFFTLEARVSTFRQEKRPEGDTRMEQSARRPHQRTSLSCT